MPEAKYLKQNNTLSVGNCESIGHLQRLMNALRFCTKKINNPYRIQKTDMEWLKTYSVSLYHTFLLEYLNLIFKDLVGTVPKCVFWLGHQLAQT